MFRDIEIHTDAIGKELLLHMQPFKVMLAE